jgi:hypothetical protein
MNSTQETAALRRLGEFFFGLAKVEGGSIGCIRALADSPSALTDTERRFLLEQMAPDEYRHALICREWARRLGADHGDAFGTHYTRDLGLTVHLDDALRVPWALMIVRAGEDESLRSFPIWSRRLREWQPELTQALDSIVADEKTHAEGSRAIAERWEREAPTLSRTHEQLYRDARRIYPVTIFHSTAKTWKHIEAVVAGHGR